MVLLSKVEKAYLSDKEQFSKAKQRYIRYRIRKKISRDAAAAFRDAAAGDPGPKVYGTERSLLHESGVVIIEPKKERPSSSVWQSEGFVIPRS
jgi:hypothetical protein